MNQEIQLSLTPQNQGLPQQPSSWAAPVSTAIVQPAQQTPLAIVHQHLRGKYVMTMIIAVVFGVLGGAAGFFVPHAGYQSTGRFRISPIVVSPELVDRVMLMYAQYVNSVVAILKTERLEKQAMQYPAWKALRPGPADAYLAEWNKDLVVKQILNSDIIEATFTSDAKDGKQIAPVAVSSLLKAYVELYGDEEKNATARKIELWKEANKSLSQKIQRTNDLIDTLLQNLGDNPQVILEKRLESHFALQDRVRELEEKLRVERAELKQYIDNQSAAPYTVEDFARVDPSMQEMYRVRSQEELEVQDFELRLGKANPATRAARTKYELQEAAMEKYANSLREKYFIKMKPDGTGGVLMPRNLTVEDDNLKHMQDVFAQESLLLEDLGRRSHNVQTLRAEKAILEENLHHANKQIDDLTNQDKIAQTFKILDDSTQPALANDKRVAFGALGFMVCAAIPVGLIVLSGLMNPKFRFSDEATGQPTAGGLTLLGILPDLPDRLSDPEQASIAAHCVHQIRTMLQINTGTEEERHVFAVTSAAPGDGKTSLTLALGLSYAACGTRTLLIDCDLVGAGLTSRMNVASADGVLEAIAHRSLLEYVRATDIADVSILPVGNGQSLHASTLSPAALRRLIEEARKHFDTILIDTGPVMGSIEASLVAAAADAVVLTVSRGQQRPLVERTIEHLKHIKANLAGIVFNRAQSSDFDRSISGLSLRSAAAGHGHNAPRMGPVARAVQSAFKPAGEDAHTPN